MNRVSLLVGLICMSVGVGVGYFLVSPAEKPIDTGGTLDRKPLYYRNPMNPDVTSPVPAKDSMGMDYVPVYADERFDDIVGTVKIDPVVQNNIGLRTAIAEYRSLSKTIRTVGRVAYDDRKIVRLHPKVEGWIKNLRVDKIGQMVADDEILLDIYSPKLVATEQEYLLALKHYESLRGSKFHDIQSGARALVNSSRARLRLLDVPEHQIKELEDSHTIMETLHIHAPEGGTVLQIGARQGQFVTPQTELFKIVDFSTVWVYADIYEYELPWVREGDLVEMTLSSQPGAILRGAVDYIYPYAELKTRTTKVRLVFENTDLLLRPEMFSNVVIHAQTSVEAVVVPAEAVVRSGDYDQIFVMAKEGVFEPRKVTLGVESSGYVAVIDGINAGDRVVVSAQFLIDSESRLREAAAKMTSLNDGAGIADEERGTGEHQHD